MHQATTPPDLDRIRSAFPALAGDTVLLENAGGSQVPRVVADAIRDYMLERYVQLDAGYRLSDEATETVHRAHDFVNLLMNGVGRGRVILGSSTTTLCRMLATCYRGRLQPGDEVVVADVGHEANVGPWVELADMGVRVVHWPVLDAVDACVASALEPLLSDRTRLVAMPHVSNLLGAIEDVPGLTAMIHAAGARVVVDGVAYAPHRAIDVAAWDVDWYVYSTYKAYGPHMAALFGTDEAIAELRGPNHFFVPDDEVPYKFEPGGASHEGCAGLLALGTYLNHLTDRPVDAPVDRATVTEAFDLMTACEAPLVERLLAFLRERDGVRIVGREHHDDAHRVGTVSFLHDRLAPSVIVRHAHDAGIGIRHGHMYAYRMCEALGIDLEEGVVRVSLVHYNSMEEIERLIGVLDGVL